MCRNEHATSGTGGRGPGTMTLGWLLVSFTTASDPHHSHYNAEQSLLGEQCMVYRRDEPEQHQSSATTWYAIKQEEAK